MARRHQGNATPAKPAAVDQQQQWDHEEAAARLQSLAATIVQVDECQAKVRQLAAELAKAKRDLRDAQLRQRIAARRELERRRQEKGPAS